MQLSSGLKRVQLVNDGARIAPKDQFSISKGEASLELTLFQNTKHECPVLLFLVAIS